MAMEFGPYEQLKTAAQLCADNLILAQNRQFTLSQTRHLHGAFCCLAKVLEAGPDAESKQEKDDMKEQTIKTLTKLNMGTGPNRGVKAFKLQQELDAVSKAVIRQQEADFRARLEMSKGAGRESNAGPHVPET